MARCGFPRQHSAVGGGSRGRGVWAWASVVTTVASALLPSQATQGQGVFTSGIRDTGAEAWLFFFNIEI